ncbi:AGAP008675-PA, partial [Anopheles gambiae str. PEST]
KIDSYVNSLVKGLRKKRDNFLQIARESSQWKSKGTATCVFTLCQLGDTQPATGTGGSPFHFRGQTVRVKMSPQGIWSEFG